jgi:pSer/pThr/pTyr-binding forkhead associated (FHA) protein
LVAEEAAAVTRRKAWLVARSGPDAGTRYQLHDGTTRIGRSPENDIVVQGSYAATVSAQHVEIGNDGGGWWIHDTGSTNGTYLNGERVEEAELGGEATIQLGNDGPKFSFMMEEVAPAGLDGTVVIPAGMLPTLPAPPPPAPSKSASAPPPPSASRPSASPPSAAETHYELIAAVNRARSARQRGLGDQTMRLMREVLERAMQRRSRRFRITIWTLAIALVLTTSAGAWKITRQKVEKAGIDEHIRELETRLNAQDSPEQADRLISELDAYEGEARSIQNSLLYRVGARQKEDFVTHQIRILMAEFGAEVYSIPPEFVDRVNVYIQQYQGPDRPNMQRAIDDVRGQIATMQRILEQEKLPPDFAYVPLVESALSNSRSSAGAVGVWQFTVPTAREFGLRVDRVVDERKDLTRSTHAACAFLRQLILDFGNGSSVMLALAAYNLGPAKVKRGLVRTVVDPIKQRNFWYLYRVRALPPETREYVPKVFAAIIIGRNPEHFGFY